MATVIPFKGLSFNTDAAGDLNTLCCPPYDIISEKQRLDFIAANENNIIRLELPKEGENPYETAAQIFRRQKDEGILRQESKPAIYIYEEEFTAGGKRRSIKGFIARIKLEEFSKGIILPHEFTLSKAKQDRFELMKATNCNFSQIYTLYMDEAHRTQALLESASSGKADMQVTDGDGVVHRIWVVTDEAVINSVCSDFDNRKLFIADGHHRYETALSYRDYCRANGLAAEGGGCDYQMAFLMDMGHPGLTVFPTHRLIKNLDGFDGDALLQKCADYFDIEDIGGSALIEKELERKFAEGCQSFAFYFDSKSYMLTLRDKGAVKALEPSLCDALADLDVTVLHTLILERLLGIDKENMAKQINLTYTKVFEEAVSGVDSGEYQAAFLLSPTRVEQIKEVASSGEKMPQKSTYFYPKPITGMVINELI